MAGTQSIFMNWEGGAEEGGLDHGEGEGHVQ